MFFVIPKYNKVKKWAPQNWSTNPLILNIWLIKKQVLSLNFIPNFGWFGIFKTLIRYLGIEATTWANLPRRISPTATGNPKDLHIDPGTFVGGEVVWCVNHHINYWWKKCDKLMHLSQSWNVLCFMLRINNERKSPFLDDWTPVRFWNGSWKQCKKCWVTEYLSLNYPSWMSFLVVKKGHQVKKGPTFHVWIEHSKFQKG